MNNNYKEDRVKNKSLWQGDKISDNPLINPFGPIQLDTRSPSPPSPILLLTHSTTSRLTGNTGVRMAKVKTSYKPGFRKNEGVA